MLYIHTASLPRQRRYMARQILAKAREISVICIDVKLWNCAKFMAKHMEYSDVNCVSCDVFCTNFGLNAICRLYLYWKNILFVLIFFLAPVWPISSSLSWGMRFALNSNHRVQIYSCKLERPFIATYASQNMRSSAVSSRVEGIDNKKLGRRATVLDYSRSLTTFLLSSRHIRV